MEHFYAIAGLLLAGLPLVQAQIQFLKTQNENTKRSPVVVPCYSKEKYVERGSI